MKRSWNQGLGASHGLPRSRRLVPLAVAAALAAALTAPMPGAALAAATGQGAGGQKAITRAPVDRLPDRDVARMLANKLPAPKGAPSTADVTAAAGSAVDPIELRVLVLATRGDPNPDGIGATPAGTWDYDLSVYTDALDHLGVPYDVYKATTRQLCVNGSWKIARSGTGADPTETSCTSGVVTDWSAGVTQDKLWDGGVHAYYQGVMQTNGTLSYATPETGFVSSALTADEWSALWTFEAAFGIRTVSASTYPTADFGLQYRSEDGDPTDARYTAAGAAAFPYVNAAGSLPIRNSWTYRAGVDPLDTSTVPVLDDGNGNVLGVIHTYANQGNRQALALTFDGAGYLTHGQVLGFGLVSWVTKGLFLGQRHAILDPQPDDIFIEDSIWQPTTPCGTAPDDPSLPEYRITGDDLSKVISWQSTTQGQAISKALKLELPFNGEGATAGYTSPARDTLTPVAKRNQGKFKWINHTWDHQNLDAISYADAVSEIQQNNTMANTLGFVNYSKTNLIQPDISGLNNGEFLRAAWDTGVRYLISDTSRTGDPAQYGVEEGRYNALQPGILEIARYPVNLYFNVSTPEQWLAEDNCLYPATAPFGHVNSYQELLDRESSVLLKYLLRGDNRPLMFHQPNLRAYDGTHSLLGDLLDATLAKYKALVSVPLTSPTMDALGGLQADRIQYNRAWKSGGLTASIVPGKSITLHSDQAVTVPVTGLNAGKAYSTETYAGQKISYVKLGAGQTITLPLR